MAGRKSPCTATLLWRPLAFLAAIALAGLCPSMAWSQGQTYKAPIPKPSSRPPDQPTGAKPFAPAEAANPAPGNYESELKRLNSLIAANDRNADAYYNRGWFHEHQGNLQMAEKDYTKAITLNRAHKEAYYNRGLIFVKKGKYEEAIRDFTEVLSLDPRSADAFCNRGNAYLQVGKPALSIKDYHDALRIRPDDPDILCNRGIAYYETGDRPRAMDDFKKAAAAGHTKAREHLNAISRSS